MEIAAGVIGLVRVTTAASLQTRKLCEGWKDAPGDVHHLRDELDTCEAFFRALRCGIAQWQLGDLEGNGGNLSTAGSTAAIGEVGKLLSRSNSILEILKGILDDLARENRDASSTVSADGGGGVDGIPSLPKRRKILWLRRVDEVGKLRKRLRHSVRDIGLFLTLLNVQFVTSRSTTLRSDESLGGSNQNEKNAKVPTDEPPDAVLSDPPIPPWDLPMPEDGLSLSRASGEGNAGNPWASVLWHRTMIHLRVPSSLCGPRCVCQCHSTRAYANWKFSGLQHILGSIHVIFSGRGLQPRLPCSSTMCRDHRRHSSVLVRYLFPGWLANAMVSVLFSPHGSPELLLRVHRVIAPSDLNFSIHGRIRAGDVEGVRSVILTRPSSIHDIDILGHPPLGYLFECRAGNPATIRLMTLLMQAGADPFQGDYSGSSVTTKALILFIAGGDGDGWNRVPDALSLTLTNMLEEEEFTELHRLLIGDLPIALSKDTLAKPPFQAQINSRTAKGWTPLHILSMRGRRGGSDSTAAAELGLLLDAGAEIDPLTNKGHTPLSFACGYGNSGIAIGLLETGASATGIVAGDRSPSHLALCYPPLQFAAGRCHDNELLDKLIAGGADVNGRGQEGETPLIQAAFLGNLGCVKHLVTAYGANTHFIDSEGDNALHSAIFSRSGAVVRFLLASGAAATGPLPTNNTGWGVLHIVATRGNLEMVNVITKAHRDGQIYAGALDPYHRDIKGKVAIDYLRERSDFDDDLAAAFQELLDSLAGDFVEGDPLGRADDTEGDSDQEFHDAAESVEG